MVVIRWMDAAGTRELAGRESCGEVLGRLKVLCVLNHYRMNEYDPMNSWTGVRRLCLRS